MATSRMKLFPSHLQIGDGFIFVLFGFFLCLSATFCVWNVDFKMSLAFGILPAHMNVLCIRYVWGVCVCVCVCVQAWMCVWFSALHWYQSKSHTFKNWIVCGYFYLCFAVSSRRCHVLFFVYLFVLSWWQNRHTNKMSHGIKKCYLNFLSCYKAQSRESFTTSASLSTSTMINPWRFLPQRFTI